MNEKFKSQICTTKEQSQRLLELGLKKETADMVYQAIGVTPFNKWKEHKIQEDFFPAWSLHRLLCMLDYDNTDTFDIMPNFAYEDVITTISGRIGCRIFNKEYLKEG